MAETNIENNQKKYILYKQMLGNMNISIRSGFYLQAVFIEYAILEDRCLTMVRVLWGDKTAESKEMNEKGLGCKLTKIKNYVENTKDAWIKKFLNEIFRNEIAEWKDLRNKVVHALMKQYNYEDFQKNLETIALRGRDLVNKVKDVTEKVKKHQAKKNNN